SARKLSLLAEHCRRLGVHAEPREIDLSARDALADEEPFDRILLDAPCSALGLIGRHPELRWRWQADRVADLVALQRALLAQVAARLAPGGLLVYSVCTVTREEGPEQLRWAVETLGLEPAPPPADLPGSDSYEGASLTLWPHRHGTDGFFIARLRRG
ncbi:MAG: RsmB/NOP family class I SAM-dependent RNA methyltransferase, partial [Myxococcales bacterium]|nr:RsmB/NOP family class I SAM-dependent RNA methyltransferase [Myxococcales bacterium]